MAFEEEFGQRFQMMLLKQSRPLVTLLNSLKKTPSVRQIIVIDYTK